VRDFKDRLDFEIGDVGFKVGLIKFCWGRSSLDLRERRGRKKGRLVILTRESEERKRDSV